MKILKHYFANICKVPGRFWIYLVMMVLSIAGMFMTKCCNIISNISYSLFASALCAGIIDGVATHKKYEQDCKVKQYLFKKLEDSCGSLTNIYLDVYDAKPTDEFGSLLFQEWLRKYVDFYGTDGKIVPTKLKYTELLTSINEIQNNTNDLISVLVSFLSNEIITTTEEMDQLEELGKICKKICGIKAINGVPYAITVERFIQMIENELVPVILNVFPKLKSSFCEPFSGEEFME